MIVIMNSKGSGVFKMDGIEFVIMTFFLLMMMMMRVTMACAAENCNVTFQIY
jgi:hypothetical protein